MQFLLLLKVKVTGFAYLNVQTPYSCMLPFIVGSHVSGFFFLDVQFLQSGQNPSKTED